MYHFVTIFLLNCLTVIGYCLVRFYFAHFPYLVDPRDDNCGEANPVSDVPYDVSHVVKSAEKLSDADKVQFLENCWRPTPSCSNLDTQYWKSGNKHLKFQIK